MSGKRIKAYSQSFSSVLAYYQQVGVSGHVLFILVSFVIPYHIPWAIGCFEHDLCLLYGNRILVKPEAQSQHSSITTLFPFLSQASLHDQKHPRCVPVLSSLPPPTPSSLPDQSVCVASVDCFQPCGFRANLDPWAVQRLKDLGGHQVPWTFTCHPLALLPEGKSPAFRCCQCPCLTLADRALREE